MNADVYFTSFRTTAQENIAQKLRRLILKARFAQTNFAGLFTAVKIHFGEPGNLAFLRPNYAKVIVDCIKERGGKVFLTDCNTLYVGGRKNALDHLDAAALNGFSPLSTGCNIIIADGLKGTDEALVDVAGCEFVTQAKIGRAVMDADIIVSLTHFKGHENTGFGGALKNIGMGCGSRAGKMEMHSAGKPVVDAKKCIGCGACQKVCAHDSIALTAKKAFVDSNKCVGCGRCVGVCPTDAVTPAFDEANDTLNKKIAEYTLAVLQNRPSFHVSVVRDISPYCDCHAENDAPIVPDVGMFASFDPVALDRACVDAVNKQPVLAGSCLAQKAHDTGDRFTDTHPSTHWESQLEHAEKIGLGTQKYNLIEI